MSDLTGEVNIVGAGPNGLAAAVVLARAGILVRVYEAGSTAGGGARTQELIESGTWHDVCSAVHPGAFSSPFFERFELTRRVRFVAPDVPYGQARCGRPGVIALRDLDQTADRLGRDGTGWRRLFAMMVARFGELAELTGDSPMRAVTRLPTALGFGLRALGQWQPIAARRWLTGDGADLLSGVEAHANQPMQQLGVTLVGLTLAATAHAVGWPVPVGGSRTIVDALVDDLIDHGGELRTDQRVRALAELPAADATVFDTTVRAMIDIAGTKIPRGYRRRVAHVAYGPGVGKLDAIVSQPVPWADPELRAAGTVHLGGSRAEMARAERAVSRGRIPDHPVTLVSVPTQFDPSRTTSPGRHVLWAYCHLPAGSPTDPTETILNEIERHAPGFRDTMVSSVGHSPAQLEQYNPNYIGGDIFAGALSTRQTLARPVLGLDPWRAGRSDVYLCSSAAAPGPGVHGMVGYRAAVSVLRNTFHSRALPSLAITRHP